jgi:hypothetical protein
MTAESVLAAAIAFVCAAVAVGFDAQTEVRTRLGRLYGTSILRTLPGFVFIIFWGVVDVVIFVVFLFNHDWAKRAFNIEIEQNLAWTGLVVGLSAVLIIRTNLATVGSFQVGGELAYSLSRASLIDWLNRARGRARRSFLGRYRTICKDTAGKPNYFTSLERVLVDLALGSEQRGEIEKQLAKIKATVPNPQSPDAVAIAREDLTALVYDYFGPTEVDRWGVEFDYGNR